MCQTSWCFGKQVRHLSRHCCCRTSQTLGLTVRDGIQKGCAGYSMDGLVSIQSHFGSGKYKDLEGIQCSNQEYQNMNRRHCKNLNSLHIYQSYASYGKHKGNFSFLQVEQVI